MKKIIFLLFSIVLIIGLLQNKVQATNSDWMKLRTVLSGGSYQESDKFSIENVEGKTVITLLDDITADVEDGTLHCEQGDYVLDLNGHILNRNLIANDGIISRNYNKNNDGHVFYIYGSLTIEDSNPSEPHVGFVGSDRLWHLGTGDGEPVTINGGIIMGGCGEYEDIYRPDQNLSQGGGIFMRLGTLIINGGNICGNTTASTNCVRPEGGGLYITGGNVIINGGSICYNTSLYENDDSGFISPQGAGICLEDGSLTINGGVIHHNVLRGKAGYGRGGGIYVDEYNTSLTINGGEISNNSATDLDNDNYHGIAGGIYMFDSGEVTISNCIITNNVATSYPGVYLLGTSGTISHSKIIGNTVKPKESEIYEAGGGLFASSPPANKGIDSYFVITDTEIKDNVGGSGTGVVLNGFESAKIESSSITNNKAISSNVDGYIEGGTGAGVSIGNTNLELIDTTITGNEADMYGAGVFVGYSEESSSTVIVGGDTIVEHNKTKGEDGINESNIYLDYYQFYDGGKISVSQTEPLSENANIGVTLNINYNAGWGPGTSLSPFFNHLTASDANHFFVTNCSSKNIHQGEIYNIEDNGEGLVIPGTPESYINEDWYFLSVLMNGGPNKGLDKWETSYEDGTRTIKLLSDFEARVSNEPLQCTNPDMNIILDLNGHVINRNVIANDGTIAWYDSDFGRNTIGAAIYVERGNLTIIDSNPSEPHVGFIGSDNLWHLGTSEGIEPTIIYGGIITGGCGAEEYYSYGGGIKVYGGTLTIEAGTVCGNTSNNKKSSMVSGGGLYITSIYNSETDSNINSNVTINGGSICYNTAVSSYEREDAPLPPRPKTKESILKSTVIVSNPSGAGIYQDSGNLTINGGTIDNNALIVGNNGGGKGTGIYFSGDLFTMNGGTITDNHIKPLGGAYSVSGGGIYLHSNNPSIIKNATITNNEATYGGGIYIDRCETTIEDSLINNNKAATIALDTDFSNGNGGGVYVSRQSIVNLFGDIITNNVAGNCAGGIYVSEKNEVITPWVEYVEEAGVINLGKDLIVKNNTVLNDNGIDEDNIYLENNEPVINISEENPLTEDAEIGVTVYYEDDENWKPGVDVTRFFNTLDETNQECFFMTNSGNGNTYKGKVFGIVDQDGKNVLEGMNKVNSTPCDDGTITVKKSYYLKDKEVNVIVVPNEGYELEKLIYNDGTDHDITDTLTFNMPDKNVTLSASFKMTGPAQKAVSINAIENGLVEIEKQSYTPGEIVNVIAIPSKGYKLKSLIYNDGENHDITSSKSFTMPDSDVVISAVFEKETTPTPDPKPNPNPNPNPSPSEKYEYKIVKTGIR